MSISKTELQHRAEILCRKLFGLNYSSKVRVVTCDDDWDELLEYYTGEEAAELYRANGYIALHDEYRIDGECLKYGDIVIKTYDRSEYEIMNTLVHELIHYELDFRGYEADDNDMDFLRECKKFGIANANDKKFDKEKKKYYIPINKEKIKEYIKMCEE